MLSAQEAAIIFGKLPQELRAPSLAPEYVVADAARDAGLHPAFFAFASGGEIFYHALHVAAVGVDDYIDLQSPCGYGGPIATTEDRVFLGRAWVEFRRWCASSRVLAEFVRFHPLLENWRFYEGVSVMNRETVWIDLHAEAFDARTRTAIRKARKNDLRVEWWDAKRLTETFPALYGATMSRVGASEGYRFGKAYFAALATLDCLRFAVCLCQGDVLGAALFLMGPKIMEYHLSATTERGRKLCATNLLIAEAATHGREEGCEQLHLGGGTDGGLDNPLLFFKSGFSERRAQFRIGSFVHAPNAYEQLRRAWCERRGPVSRVLFYRDAA